MKTEMVIGKYTLESLTNGMYSSPLDLYREYIQNAVDSIDEAVVQGLISSEEARIDIAVNTASGKISIRDNGTGIPLARALQTLLDIGNSKKDQCRNRGFRGIGRLAGLGYCDSLTFITSSKGESYRTVVVYDADKLKGLLIPGQNDDESIYDVLDAVVSSRKEPEKEKKHYFEVQLNGVALKETLMNYDVVSSYLRQNAPLPFAPEFRWGEEINKKLAIEGYLIPSYNLFLFWDNQKEQLFKPYTDKIISDRIKKLSDNIKDIEVKLLKASENALAVIWYANTNFYGTIVDSNVKGIRIRQGNILIGDKTTCTQFFKEDRFNGWVIGEVYVMDRRFIANSRRDNFEKNEVYFQLVECMKEISLEITKEIRRLSYGRSLSTEKKEILEKDVIEDVNDLCIEDMTFASDVDELSLMEEGDSRFEAESDYFSKLSLLLGKKNAQTKYSALNINDNLTVEQRKVLERVFDLIYAEYSEEDAAKISNLIANKF